MSKSIKQAALDYIPKTTRNISELQSVSAEVLIEEGIANEGKENEFTYNFVHIEGQDYRVPDKVLSDLKAILQKKPTLKTFSVSKQGQGLNTQYTVIPLE